MQAYYEFVWEDPGAVSAQPQKQLNTLPDSLQIELAREMHKNLLAKIPVFRLSGGKAANSHTINSHIQY